MVKGSNPVAVNIVPVSSKEFLDIQATIKCRFTLKRVRDMIVTYIPLLTFHLNDNSRILIFVLFKPKILIIDWEENIACLCFLFQNQVSHIKIVLVLLLCINGHMPCLLFQSSLVGYVVSLLDQSSLISWHIFFPNSNLAVGN